MRVRFGLLFLGLVCLCGPVFADHPVEFVNGLWLEDGTFVARTFYSVEGRFESVHEGAVQTSIDLEGLYIIPPLGDAHTHQFADGSDGVEAANAFLRDGIFYAKNPNSIPSLARAASGAVNKPAGVEVIYSNGGLTAPGGHPVQIYDRLSERIPDWSAADMENRAYFLLEDEAMFREKWPLILEGDPDFIKTYLDHSGEYAKRSASNEFYGKRGLDPGLLPGIVRAAHAEGLTVTVHVTTRGDFTTAILSGADEIAHLPLERLSQQEADLAARQGITVVTTTISHRDTRGVDDPAAVYRHNLQMLHDAGVRLVLGTDSQRTVVAEIMSIAGMKVFTNTEILTMATTTTPQWIFPSRKIGRLADGYEASFLALSENPLEDPGNLGSIRARIKKGNHIQIHETPGGKPSVADALHHPLMMKGVDAAVEEYHRLKREHPDDFDFSEGSLNALGYGLISHGYLDEAIRIFMLNVEMFPDSSNPYDSLAEAYMTKGEKELAILNYRKSLELNPRNENARQKLKELESPATP